MTHLDSAKQGSMCALVESVGNTLPDFVTEVLDNAGRNAMQATAQSLANVMSDDDLQALAKAHSHPGKKYVTKTTLYVRDPWVAEYAKKRASGHCQLCGSMAPFVDPDGLPYLEAHHIKWLSQGGADSIENVVALCPNCHRRMHVVKDSADVAKLEGIAKLQA